MSKATIVSASIYVLLGVACATGGQNGGDIDANTSTHQDASNVISPDAPRIRMDAAVVTPPQDAQVSQVPQDAPAQSGPFCSANSQCTTAGQCCVTLGGPQGFCGPGTVVLGQCVPQ
ncbi:MAG TPA: hypothetical protein VMZ53_12610 [Kofleriaceae bacterium]|nr:hypothetical protein [Kofleriaceae bacterium]